MNHDIGAVADKVVEEVMSHAFDWGSVPKGHTPESLTKKLVVDAIRCAMKPQWDEDASVAWPSTDGLYLARKGRLIVWADVWSDVRHRNACLIGREYSMDIDEGWRFLGPFDMPVPTLPTEFGDIDYEGTIEMLNRAKENAVAHQDFDSAASIRDLVDEIKAKKKETAK